MALVIRTLLPWLESLQAQLLVQSHAATSMLPTAGHTYGSFVPDPFCEKSVAFL
jgi:hypothetical protein